MNKICTSCKIDKPLEEFHVHKGFKDGHNSQCKSCRNPKAREYSKLSPRKYSYDRSSELKRKYGITQADYLQMYESQKGACAICKRPYDLLQVDHCHDTGKVRGLLCVPCNTALGKFRDDPVILQSAISYLQRP